MDPSPNGSHPSLENGAVLEPTNQPCRYVTRRGSRRKRPLITRVCLEMLSPDLTQNRNVFDALDPDVPAYLSSVLSPSLVASTSGSDPLSSHPHQTVRLPERPAHLTSLAVIIGSSMVRNISVPKAKTLCYPGARVQDITRLFPTVLR